MKNGAGMETLARNHARDAAQNGAQHGNAIMRNGAEEAAGRLPVARAAILAALHFATRGHALKGLLDDGAKMAQGPVRAAPAAVLAGVLSGAATGIGAKLAAFQPRAPCAPAWPRVLSPP